ncbi:hypothetical protein HanIR_Chr03g0120331 [Helianthus annuus]|nr:hypothetical protein HanIR_Chr03g0120331 [Helianthus annuus]
MPPIRHRRMQIQPLNSLHLINLSTKHFWTRILLQRLLHHIQTRLKRLIQHSPCRLPRRKVSQQFRHKRLRKRHIRMIMNRCQYQSVQHLL